MEYVGEGLPADIRLSLAPSDPPASPPPEAASLFTSQELPPDEKRIFKRIFATLRADEPTHIDEIVERLVSHLSSFQILAALFELELGGRVRVLPGKYYVRVT